MRRKHMSLLGDEATIAAAANAPLSSAQAVAAKREIVKMRGALKRWLKYRAINDSLAAGVSVAQPLLKNPRARRAPAAVIALRLASTRKGDEAELAEQLHQLLSEVFDAASLPDPDTAKNPGAAVQLAKLAISGAIPGETSATQPTAAGFIWMWPLVIVVGAIAFVIATSIKSNADAAAERERLECIKAGACTDYGFWLKVGAVVFISWFAWDKLGVGERVKHAIKGRGTKTIARR